MEKKETINGKIDKIDRFDWNPIRDTPGTLKWIKKEKLEVDKTYQRTYIPQKAREVAAEWSWVGGGTITVAKRGDEYFVIEGQHRVMAALQRSDIDILPCIVFEGLSVKAEAAGFIKANIHRKPVDSLDKFRANLVAEDRVALYVDSILRKNGIRIAHSLKGPLRLKSVAFCHRMARISPEHFEKTMELIKELCINEPIYEKLLAGIFYLSRNLITDLTDNRLRKRILLLGAPGLLRAAQNAAWHIGRGGDKVWATGMQQSINKGLHNKFKFKEEAVISE